MKNVTQERMNKLTAIKWSDLPLERAVKQVRGDGKRVLATFEDPNCGYCKASRQGSAEARQRDVIYTFLLPILSQDSVDKSKAIWCATDRAKAWNDWMVDGRDARRQDRLRRRQSPRIRNSAASSISTAHPRCSSPTVSACRAPSPSRRSRKSWHRSPASGLDRSIKTAPTGAVLHGGRNRNQRLANFAAS